MGHQQSPTVVIGIRRGRSPRETEIIRLLCGFGTAKRRRRGDAMTHRVMAVRDGLPKFKDFPKEFGGSGEMLPE
jgi:hypothetical protein